MADPNKLESEARAAGLASAYAGRSFPPDSWEPEDAHPSFDSAAGAEAAAAADAAIAKAKPQLALVAPLSTFQPLCGDAPQPMSSLAAKWPGFYPEFAIRSALFQCARVGAGASTASRSIKIAGRKDETVKLSSSGPMLTMADKDVWEIALDIARERAAPYGETFEASFGEFAKRMGLKASGSFTARIRGSLQRLAACEIDLVDGSTAAKGRMIAGIDGSGHALRIQLDPQLIEPALSGVKLFKIDSARRRALGASTFTKWLHDFLSTHAKPSPLTLDYLREISGCGGHRAEFPAALRRALDEIQALGPDEESRPLAKSYSLDESTKSSGEWKLICEAGAEKPKFKQPPQPAVPRPNL